MVLERSFHPRTSPNDLGTKTEQSRFCHELADIAGLILSVGDEFCVGDGASYPLQDVGDGC